MSKIKVTVCIEGGCLTGVKVTDTEEQFNYPYVDVDIIDEDVNSEAGNERGTVTGQEEFPWFESEEI